MIDNRWMDGWMDERTNNDSVYILVLTHTKTKRAILGGRHSAKVCERERKDEEEN